MYCIFWFDCSDSKWDWRLNEIVKCRLIFLVWNISQSTKWQNTMSDEDSSSTCDTLSPTASGFERQPNHEAFVPFRMGSLVKSSGRKNVQRLQFEMSRFHLADTWTWEKWLLRVIGRTHWGHCNFLSPEPRTHDLLQFYQTNIYTRSRGEHWSAGISKFIILHCSSYNE